MIHPQRLLPLLVAALFVVGCASKDKEKLREPAKLTRIESSARVEKLWSDQIGNGAQGRPSGLRPVLAEDGLFVAASDGRVALLDPANGKTRWETRSKARIVSGPSVVDRLIVVGTLDAEVIAYSRADGKEIWRSRASSEVLAAPAGAGDIVVARSIDGRIFGLDAGDGSRRWSFDRTEPTLTLRGLSSPVVDGNSVIVGLDSGRAVAVRLRTGEPVWDQPIALPNGRSEIERLTDIDATPLLTDYGLLIGSYGGDVAMIDPTDGESRWKRSIRTDVGMALGKSSVFVSDADGVVWALDSGSGAVVWKNESLKHRRLSAPAYLRGQVVVADFEGYLHFLNESDGSFTARTRAGSEPVLAPMVANDSTLYVQNAKGRLSALTVQTK
jgi:outer membrane protein assembly factor BamB